MNASVPGSYVIPGKTAMGGSQEQKTGLLLDWLTLRMPVRQLPPTLQDKLYKHLNSVCSFRTDSNGEPVEVLWESRRLDFEKLRSDAPGFYFTVTYVADVAWFYLGASPASLAHDCNVFGSLDINECADLMIQRARKGFGAFLASSRDWELVRMDITGNYALPDVSMVKTALRTLMQTDSARRKASSGKGIADTVYWSPSSDRFSGKAYHKGPHLRHLAQKGQISIDPEFHTLADRLLRLELRVGSRFFREQKNPRNQGQMANRHWTTYTSDDLTTLHRAFFGPICDGMELKNMGRVESVELIAAVNGITQGSARAAYGTYRAIKDNGFDEVKASMSERTFYRHKKYLLAAGFSEADMCAGNVLLFAPVRVQLARPVSSWTELRLAA